MDSTKRRFLSAITAGAALIPVAGIGTATAAPIIRNNNEPDRKGQVGKRYAMVVDLRKCVGCQACTVACSIENQAPIGQFRTTVKQYEVRLSDGTTATEEVKSFMLPSSVTTVRTHLVLLFAQFKPPSSEKMGL
ncbi:tetrathionate reductase subunit B [Vibrio sp. JCM 19236]|nr:tetrathionate reductase subunit B [Vibrio sp. JCM 19236]